MPSASSVTLHKMTPGKADLLDTLSNIVFLLLANFWQILTWKIWFWPNIQRILHAKKKTKIHQLLNIYFYSKSPDFYDKFQ